MLLSTRRAAAAAACLLAVAGCNADPAEPSPSPVRTVRPSPPETSIERQQRLDFEAAEKSYRTFIAEKNRLGMQGGASEASSVMKATAAGPYLDFYVALLREQKATGKRYTSGTKIGYVNRGPYAPDQLTLLVCEDGSSNRVLDKNGKQIGSGTIQRRALFVRPIDGAWKMWDGEEQGEVKTCEN